MKTLFTSWFRWFWHGVRILVAGFGAYFIVALCAFLPRLLLEIRHPIASWAFLVAAPLVWLAGIALFGYLFTKLYSHTTWCTQAIADIKKNDRKPARSVTRPSGPIVPDLATHDRPTP
jgi:hypothetical protein